jgi:iron complex outermembrane receptor protein
VTFFDVEQSNISTVDADFNATALGEAGSKGLEVDLSGYITDTLRVWLSYSFVDAETKNDFNDPDFGTEVPAGSDLINIPENQLSLQVTKDMDLYGRNLSLIGGLLYVDDRNGFFVDQSFRLPSYTTVRLAASYNVTDSITLRAEVNNLFDEEHFTNSFANVWVQPGTPVNGRITADFRF